jgi:hypothetical protein
MPRRDRRSGRLAGEARSRDPRLREAAKLLGRLADEQCEASASFAERSQAARRVAAALLSELAKESNDGNEREDPEG